MCGGTKRSVRELLTELGSIGGRWTVNLVVLPSFVGISIMTFIVCLVLWFLVYTSVFSTRRCVTGEQRLFISCVLVTNSKFFKNRLSISFFMLFLFHGAWCCILHASAWWISVWVKFESKRFGISSLWRNWWCAAYSSSSLSRLSIVEGPSGKIAGKLIFILLLSSERHLGARVH